MTALIDYTLAVLIAATTAIFVVSWWRYPHAHLYRVSEERKEASK